MVLRWLLFVLFICCLLVYSSSAIKTVFKNPWIYYIFVFVNLMVIGNFILHIVLFRDKGLVSPYFMYSFGLFIMIIVFQFLVISFLFVEDLVRLPQWVYHLFTKGFKSSFEYSPQRREFISKLALLIASIPVGALFLGMLRGKYNYRVIKHKLSFDNLPPSFDGFKIVHISDFHCGSFDNEEKVKYGIEMINDQRPDLILFSGDMVNNMAKEILPWKDIISSLNAPFGKFAVLGNHDYGDYVPWESEAKKKENMNHLLSYLNDMGFQVLLNESKPLKNDKDEIALIGVENWRSDMNLMGKANGCMVILVFLMAFMPAICRAIYTDEHLAFGKSQNAQYVFGYLDRCFYQLLYLKENLYQLLIHSQSQHYLL